MRKIEIVLVTLFTVLFLSSMTLAVDCPIPDTGQTKCYANTQEILCPSPGEPFYGQDAQYPCNPKSYTKLDANGNDLLDTATNWVMVRDNVTGLIWEVKTDDGSIHDMDDKYNWDDAQDVIIATLNSQNFGGYSDWRLPTVMELSFLVDRDRYKSSINTTYFPNTKSSYHWSSTSCAALPSNAWVVNFLYGHVADGFGYYYVRAVRGGPCGSFGNFIDNGDGTITETVTGLMWQKDTAPGTYNWQQALLYCESLTFAGYTDWRLPNINELQSIVDYSRYDPSINTDFFPSTVPFYYWSSTTNAYGRLYAWYVDFLKGWVNSDFKSSIKYVRAVRGGKCGSIDTWTTTTVTSTTTTISGSTTSTISGSTTTTACIDPCCTEQIYGEYSEQTELLRYLRDHVLTQTPEGQELIRLYYEWSPVIVEMIEEDEEFKAQVKEMIDEVLELVEIGVE